MPNVMRFEPDTRKGIPHTGKGFFTHATKGFAHSWRYTVSFKPTWQNRNTCVGILTYALRSRGAAYMHSYTHTPECTTWFYQFPAETPRVPFTCQYGKVTAVTRVNGHIFVELGHSKCTSSL